MRTTLILTSLLFLVACGSGEPSVTANTEPALSDTTLTSDPAESTEHDTLIELKEKNQITDYAEFFLQAPVFKDREKMDWNAGASATLSHQHYYEVLDIENGYAEVTGSYEGKHTFAIWRMANGNDLVGHTESFCGPVCDYLFRIYEVEGNDEREVSTKVIPYEEINAHKAKMENEMRLTGDLDESVPTQLKFILPQKGTSLNVYLSMNSNELEFPLMTLKWNKSTFEVDEVFDEVITKP